MKYPRVRWFKSNKDLEYNLDKYLKEKNILFITGLVGSGKSTLARNLGEIYKARVVVQDYLSWSDCYNNDECVYFVDLFQKKYPETKEYFENNEWRKNNLTTEVKRDYRRKFDKMVVDYAKENKDIIFIYEGSDLFCKSDTNIMKGEAVIIKRTGALKSFIRAYKRGNKANDTIIKKMHYLKRMLHEFNKFYIKDLPKLNNFIIMLNEENNKNI